MRRRRPGRPNAYIIPPTFRRPLFTIRGRWYVDLLFNFHEALALAPGDLAHLLQALDLRRVVIGCRLSRRDARDVEQALQNLLGEMYSYMVRDGAARWVRPPRIRRERSRNRRAHPQHIRRDPPRGSSD